MTEDPLSPDRQALERGDYGRCLRLLEPLALLHPAATPLGGSLRLLMVTALLGQGNDEQAASCCRSLRVCRDLEIRAQAKDLQLILEAPALPRPANWSLTLPAITEAAPLEGRLKPGASPRRRQRAPGPPSPLPPPTGPTRGPVGFAIAVLAVLLLLGSLLSGCLRVETDLRFGPPGRLQLQQTLSSESGRLLPFQRQFSQELQAAAPAPKPRLELETRQGVVSLRSANLNSAEISRLLQSTVATAAQLGGIELPAPDLQLKERNWLVGAHQQFSLEVDLRAVRGLPGLELGVQLGPLAPAALRLALPLAAVPDADGIRWPLQPGALNRIELVCWRWSRLGVGAVVILVLLGLALGLQRLRWQAGFGWPELPSPSVDEES